jgi:hypothetical protein
VILYAGDKGYPSVHDLPDAYIQKQKDKIASLTVAFLLIEPYREIQSFVTQCLNSLLKMIGAIKIEDLQA